jgi:lactoylglutathione lyase
MAFKIAHSNINVTDLDRSIDFYDRALGLKPVKRINAPDGSFALAFLSDGTTEHQIELTWLRDKEGSYDLGDNESHIAFLVDDYDKAYAQHKEMGCICFENKAMGLYFIEDPDGYWLEIIPQKRS